MFDFLNFRSLQDSAELKSDHTYQTNFKSPFRSSDRLQMSQSWLSLSVCNIKELMSTDVYTFSYNSIHS